MNYHAKNILGALGLGVLILAAASHLPDKTPAEKQAEAELEVTCGVFADQWMIDHPEDDRRNFLSWGQAKASCMSVKPK
jgi:hypothetical protein